MASFPVRDADVLTFAQELATGLAHNPGDFPAPPVGSSALAVFLNVATAKDLALQAARAAFAAAAEEKQEAFAALKRAMKDDLKYAEVAVQGSDEKLKELGWAGRRMPRAVAVPGQVRELTVVEEGPDWVTLRWKAPVEGGKTVMYRVEQWDAASSGFVLATAVMVKKARLENVARGVELMYRVVASNKSGEGMASNSVRMVL